MGGSGLSCVPHEAYTHIHPPSACGEKGSRKELVGGGVLECCPWIWTKGFTFSLLVFFQIQDLVVGPGGKISLRYSRVTGKEVELLTMERKPVERKLGFDLYTLKILQNTVLFLCEYEVNWVCLTSLCIRITSLLTLRFLRLNARVSDSANPEWGQESVI